MERDKGLGQAVLLVVNGWAFGPSVWNGFMETLYEKLGFRIDTDFINWDGLEGLDCFDERIGSKLDSYGERDIIIVAWSLGAMASLSHLNRSRCAVLISPTFRFTRREGETYGWDLSSLEAMKRGLLREKEAVISSFAGKLVSKRESWHGKGLLSCMEEDMERFSAKDLEVGLEFLKSADMEDFVSGVETRTLLLHGGRDRIVLPVRCQQMKVMNEKMEVLIMDDSGHLPFYTKSEDSAVHIAGHIRRNFDDRQEEA